MPFQRFSRDTARTDTNAKWLSVQANGAISISFAALQDIGTPDNVYLLFDPDSRRIGIQAAPSGAKDAYAARLQGRRDNPQGARVVSASAFFKHIGLDAKRASQRYDTTSENDMVVAKMPDEAFT